MKKVILSIAIMIGIAVAATAQDKTVSSNATVTNKFGHAILPAAGDFALGIDAVPFLEYLGNMNNQSSNIAAPSFDGFPGRIYGKYFLNENTAVRAKLFFDFGNDRQAHTVIEDGTVLNPDKTVVDYKTVTKNELKLSVGYEMRRGYRRLQGFYGVEAGIGINKSDELYKYGNVMTVANATPSTWDFTTNAATNPASRTLEKRGGFGYEVGVGGFVGLEYFFAPKMSIGGELGVSISGANNPIGKQKYQLVEGGAVKEHENRVDQAGNANFHFKTNVGGSLFLMFHF